MDGTRNERNFLKMNEFTFIEINLSLNSKENKKQIYKLFLPKL